jgi:putative oxidoreductase
MLIGFFFVFFGFWNFIHRAPTIDFMKKKHLPLSSMVFYFGIILQILCGLGIMFNYASSLAALLLIPFNIIAVFIFHAFWTYSDEIRRLNMICFVTNLTASLGALILLIDFTEIQDLFMRILS